MARRYILWGRVQGVAFRYFTLQEARSLGISGWVRNLADGTVEVHAEGEQSAMTAFEERLRQGPPWSDVRGVDEHPADEGGFDSFTIER